MRKVTKRKKIKAEVKETEAVDETRDALLVMAESQTVKVKPEVVKKETPEPEIVKVTPVKSQKTMTKRAWIMLSSGLTAMGGVLCFAIYVITLNMLLGGLGIFLVLPGGIIFYIYWKKEDEIITEKGKAKTQHNTLNIFQDKIEFTTMLEPTEYYMKCRNDGKKYNINIWNPDCETFRLPDTQYMSPEIFGQRVLQLPAHRKIFTKRQDLLQKLKPLFVILGIIAVWILIITTTGDDNSEVTTWQGIIHHLI